MRARHRLVERERLARVYLSARVRVRDRNGAVIDIERIRIRQYGVGRRVARVLRDRLLEIRDRLGDAFLGPLVPGEPPLEIEPISADVLGVPPWYVRGQSGEHRGA